VLKAAEQASYSPLRLGELCLEAGIPPGVINVISGYGESAGAVLACYNVMDPAVPFGGRKMSGYESEGGRHQLDAYLNIKLVWINTD